MLYALEKKRVKKCAKHNYTGLDNVNSTDEVLKTETVTLSAVIVVIPVFENFI